VTSVVVFVLTTNITATAVYAIQGWKLKAKMRTEFMAEQAAKFLLENPKWGKRSFSEIKKRLGGFDDNELRKILTFGGMTVEN